MQLQLAALDDNVWVDGIKKPKGVGNRLAPNSPLGTPVCMCVSAKHVRGPMTVYKKIIIIISDWRPRTNRLFGRYSFD